MRTKLLPLIGLISFFLGSFTFAGAVSTFITQQGGTGTTSPSGILYGDNGATSHVNTVTIGNNLTFSGGTLSASGGSSSFSYLFPGNATTTGLGLYASTTIGNGTSITGLTINGTATTTTLCFTGDICRTTWPSGGGGTVTAISVATANGFAGSSSGGATPALTLTTSQSGLLQGNGTAITGISGTSGQFPYYNGTNTLFATSTLFLATTGFIGVNTTSPAALFSVNGTASSTTSVISGLGTLAGTFIAANPQGQLIATTTPSGGGNTITTGIATSSLTTTAGAPYVEFSVVSGDTIMSWGVIRHSNSCDTTHGVKLSLTAWHSSWGPTGATSTEIANVGNFAGAGSEYCSASAAMLVVATTTETIRAGMTDQSDVRDYRQITAQKIH